MSKIYFVGSSIFSQWENCENVIPSGYETENIAIGGTQTISWLSKIDTLYKLVGSGNAAAVCYYCGSNDINFGVGDADIFKNIMATVEKIHSLDPKTKFVYFSIIKSPQKRHAWSRIDQLNAKIKQALTASSDHFIDVNPVFFDENGNSRAIFTADDNHLTPAAYTAMEALVQPVMAGIL